MSGIATAIGASAVVGAYSANKASKAQQQSGREGMAAEREMFDISRQDQEPWRKQGEAGLNRLAHMLGLNPLTGSGGSAPISRDDLIDTSQDIWRPNEQLYANDAGYRAAWDKVYGSHQQRFNAPMRTSKGSGLEVTQDDLLRNGFDMNAYNAAQTAQMKEEQQNDPTFGTLMRNFSQDDLNNDPVYKTGLEFGLNEGTKGINRLMAASGNLLSGATLKELARYGNDYGSTKANDAYNRFKLNQDSSYNKLAGLAGIGQQTTAQMGSQAVATGQSMNNSLTDIGNARGAGYIGMGNSLSNAVGQGVNAWQTNELIKRYPLK